MEHAFEVPSGAVDGRIAVEVVLSHHYRERTWRFPGHEKGTPVHTSVC
jgi:hypothetical protein